MAINIEVINETPEEIAATLAKQGHAVEKEEPEAEEEGKESKETPAKEEPPKEEKPLKEAAKAPKKEEAPDDKEKEDWDALPAWAKKQVTKLREKNRELRDERDDKRAVREAASAGGGRESAQETKLPEGFTYCGRPKPKLSDFEKAEDPYAALADAAGEWHADEKIAKVQAEAYARAMADEIQRTQKAFQERQDEAKEVIPGYAEVLEEATEEAGFMATGTMHEAILKSDVGPYLLYHLVQNPDDFKRIKALGDTNEAAKAMGKLEAKVEAAVEKIKAESKKEPPKKKTVSSAPEPTQSLRGGQTRSKTLQELAGPTDREVEMPIKFNHEYEKKRNEQRRGR